MPSKPTLASAAVADLLRDRRRSLGWTLRQVEALSRESGHPIPHSTLARIEAGRFDPGVRRLRQLLDLYQLPIQAAGEVLDLEAIAGATPIERDPEKLKRRAILAWEAGNIPEAFACFLAFRRRVPNDAAHREMRHEAILMFAVATSALGRVHLSRHMLDEMLLENPSPDVLVRILIQQSVAWRGLGSSVAARAFIDRAAALVRPDLPQYRGWIEHQLGLLRLADREFKKAEASFRRAIGFQRKARAPHHELLAHLSIVELRFEEGRPKDAIAEAKRVESLAKKHGFNRVRLSALLHQARAHQRLGAMEQSREILRSVLADSMVANDNRTSFYAHYYLWKAEQALGNAARASVELNEAAYYLSYVDQTEPEAADVRAHRPRARTSA